MRLETPGPEDATDALVDGDRILVRGTARAALQHRDFRIVWSGTFASNIGTWMQNVLLGAYGYTLTHSATYVGLLFFAQLGPLLILSNVGGALADVLDRRRLLLWTQWEQLGFSIVLAFLATASHPSRAAILACVLVIGTGNALGAPALSAVLPTLVPRPDLPGAVALQSVQMNLSRVIGPVIGAAIYAATGAAPVFFINAATYLFAITALLVVRYPRRATSRPEVGMIGRIVEGFRIAHADRLVRRILIVLVTLSFFSLAFIGLMPALARPTSGSRPAASDTGSSTPSSASVPRSAPSPSARCSPTAPKRGSSARRWPRSRCCSPGLGSPGHRPSRLSWPSSSDTRTSSSSRPCRRCSKNTSTTRSGAASSRCGSWASAGRSRLGSSSAASSPTPRRSPRCSSREPPWRWRSAATPT